MLSSGGPTAQEQYMLQLVNEARTNPAAVAAQISSSSNLTPDVTATLNYYNVNLQQAEQKIASTPAQPPLAWNQDLATAAQGQSQYQADNQVQSHTGANGSTTQQRIQAAGYANATSSGENAYAYASSVMESMQAFLFDWGVPSDGHRINIQQPGVSPQNAYTSVGIGIVQTNPSTPSVGPMVITQDFASQTNSLAQVVGVAYNDNAGTNFYLPGEGVGNVQIDAVNLKTGAVSSTQTWDAGGYELALAPGQYQLIASQNGSVIKSSAITINNLNIEQDFVLTNTWQGGTRAAAIAAAQPTTVSTPVVSTPTVTVTPPAMTPVTVSVSTPTTTKVATPTPTPSTTPQPAVSTPVVASSQPTQSTPSNSTSSLFSFFKNSWSAWNAATN